MRDINLTLSTSEANNHIGQVVIRQDDDNTQKIIANITENGKPKSLAGLTVFFNAMIDNTIIARDLATIEGSSKVSYILKSAFYQREGRIKAFFTFERGNQRESTADFIYFVTRGTCRNIKQGNYIYEFENLKGVVGDIIGSGDLLPLIKKIDEVQGSVDSYRTETNNKMSTLESKTNNKITSVEKDLSQKISTHEKRTDNPHKVTAAQTGAITMNDLNEVFDTKVFKINYGSAFSDYSDNQPFVIRRYGKIAQLSGAFTVNTELEKGKEYRIGAFPSGAQPYQMTTFIGQGSGNSEFLLTINTDGGVFLSRHRSGAEHINVEKGEWLAVTGSFLAK